MESANQELFNLIDKSNHILLVIPNSPSIDNISSAFAIAQFLDKRKKDVTLFCQENIPEKISFLKKPDSIIKDFSGSRDFLLIFNTEKNKIIKTHTEKKGNEYIITLTPEKGSINPKDFSFIPANFKYDLIITIGVKSLESLGKIYLENSDLFFEVPKINLDYSSLNENYGQNNIINLTASSCAEIIAEMLIEKSESEINQAIAQALLTGIIASTESFQKPTTSPKAMILAAKLMKYKADQAIIIRHLYKTKPLSFMKLWGRVMARLNWNEEYQMAWSLISGEDFVQSRAGESDIPLVLEEIEKNFSQGQIFAILYSYGHFKTKVQLITPDEKIKQKIINFFETEITETNKMLCFEIKEQDLIKAEKKLLEKIKQIKEE